MLSYTMNDETYTEMGEVDKLWIFFFTLKVKKYIKSTILVVRK